MTKNDLSFFSRFLYLVSEIASGIATNGAQVKAVRSDLLLIIKENHEMSDALAGLKIIQARILAVIAGQSDFLQKLSNEQTRMALDIRAIALKLQPVDGQIPVNAQELSDLSKGLGGSADSLETSAFSLSQAGAALDASVAELDALAETGPSAAAQTAAASAVHEELKTDRGFGTVHGAGETIDHGIPVTKGNQHMLHGKPQPDAAPEKDESEGGVITGDRSAPINTATGSAAISEAAPDGQSQLEPEVAKGVSLRTDGPTLPEYIAYGYKAESYPPPGYADKRTPEQIAEMADKAAREGIADHSSLGEAKPPQEIVQ